MTLKPHLFDLSADIWNALSRDEIVPTADAMRQLDLYHLPADDRPIYVRTPPNIKIVHPEIFPDELDKINAGHFLWRVEDNVDAFRGSQIIYHIEYHDLQNDHAKELMVATHRLSKDFRPRTSETFCKEMFEKHANQHPSAWREDDKIFFPLDEHMDAEYTSMVRDALVVILASKGIIKETREHKLAALGVGKPSRFSATTTIRLTTRLQVGNATESPSHRPSRPHLRRGHIRSQHYGKGNAQVKDIWIAPVFVNADKEFIASRREFRVRW